MSESIPEGYGFSRPCDCDKEGGNQHEYSEECAGWNGCYHCDNGWFPCNQNCIVSGDSNE
ncbi:MULTISPECIES: hypothetical protein [Burkholderia]|uniref:hypothetical protein n=1 Tax=Burkholderia TaxID=32008 RepID=UPI0012BBB262|nr:MULTISPECIES: hypothetical protein [Burkholderia]